ncbi:HAD family hydrolase [Fretibacter rubidus]|uniref:HAD family hydrolase n=1 Tax=Fretibacter rubidus TaxID=570162 RepID=UPI00352B8AA2
MSKLILFDLGGVVVDWTGITELAALSGLSREEAAKRFASSQVSLAYERGEISDDVFSDHMIELFGLPFTRAQFKLQWRLWVGQPFDGVVDMIKGLRGHFTTACLSNTNAMHWDHLLSYLPLEPMFDHIFASHQIAAVKPHAHCYQIVIDRTGFKAQDIVFFDDTQANVDAAKALGMTAYKVQSDVGVMPTIRSILPQLSS